MVDVFEHSARLDTAAVEECRDLVQVFPIAANSRVIASISSGWT